MALDNRQKTTTATAVRPIFAAVSAAGVNSKGAGTKPFLTHWRGRARRTSAGNLGFTTRTYTGGPEAEQAPGDGVCEGITQAPRASFPGPPIWRTTPDLAAAFDDRHRRSAPRRRELAPAA